MSPPYSVTQASLHLELYKPLRIFVWILAAWPILLLLWVALSQLTVTTTADVVDVEQSGLIMAEFPAETEIAIGQAARIQLVGQQRDVLPATVIANDTAAGLVTLLPDEPADRLLLINEEVIVEQVQLIVDERSPLMLFLGG